MLGSITIPEELSAQATNVTWLKIEGPILVMNDLLFWMMEQNFYPLYHCGGSAGPSFINFAFKPEHAALIMDKITDLKLKMPPKECAS
jgi:hypothetical protein